MKKKLFSLILLTFFISSFSCTQPERPLAESGDFQWQTEQFADLRTLRYQVPGFEELTLQQKELLYYLYEAALSGRDIIWDQNYRHNLRVRKTLENIVKTYTGTREGKEWEEFLVYVKRVWFSNGIHHHYATLKFEPDFSKEFFIELVKNSDAEHFPLLESESIDHLLEFLFPIIFDPAVDPKKINLDPDADQVLDSATNFYDPDLTEEEVVAFYGAQIDKANERPVSYGLNSKLVKEDGEIKERVWKKDGMYGEAIEKIVYWLKKAVGVAENEQQQAALEKLVEYYETGDLKIFDEYSILWVQDTESVVDVVNGFIEVYGDPLAYKGSYESVVSFRDPEATRRIEAIKNEAQWFEDNSPILDQHKKEEVKGITAKVITVVVEGGDATPSTPIGINLPNSNWIRQEHGSKSVSLGNLVYSYDESARTSGVLEEFTYSQEEIDRARKYGSLADMLHTDMHEVIGHASGRLEPGVATPKETLKTYSNTLEESRADLVALYYQLDPKLIEIGVQDSLEVGKAGYDGYIHNGLMKQLARLKPGEDLEQAHMRNRQLISSWVYEKGKAENVIERKTRDGKTYFVINDYEKLRELFGELLREVQRIKSQGDYEAAKNLVETYGVKVDKELHAEVLERNARLDRAPYAGFINPVLKPVKDAEGKITDVVVEYPDDFTQQMLYYGEKYSFLPLYN